MNKEERAAYNKKHYEENRERIAAHKKAFREENREKIAARQKKYREENREKIAARQKKYREENPEKIAASYKKRYEKNREKIIARQNKYKARLINDPITRKEFALKRLLCGAYARSKKKNLEYNLDYNWAVENFKETCPVFGIPLTFFTSTDSSATIDRFDNNKGYTKENCHIISWKANMIKNSSSPTEIQKVCKWVLEVTEKCKL